MRHPRPQISLGFMEKTFSAGSHICYIFNDDEERLALVNQFLRAGRAAKERLLYVVDTKSPAELRAQLDQLERELTADADLEISTSVDTYFAQGRFSAEYMLSLLKSFYEE